MQEALSGGRARDEKEQEDKERTREFEIDLTRALSNHKISNSFIDFVIDLIDFNGYFMSQVMISEKVVFWSSF